MAKFYAKDCVTDAFEVSIANDEGEVIILVNGIRVAFFSDDGALTIEELNDDEIGRLDGMLIAESGTSIKVTDSWDNELKAV